MSDFTSVNKFSSMPFIPYNIISYLAKDDRANGLFKLLKYSTYEALDMPDLTLSEKLQMIYKNQPNQNDFSIFLHRLVENEELVERTILKVYKHNTKPEDSQRAVVCYEFDVLVGAKTPLVKYQNIPCSRKDVVEMFLLNCLNGADVNAVGWLKFDARLSRYCQSAMGIGNNTTYDGTGIVMAVQVVDLDDKRC